MNVSLYMVDIGGIAVFEKEVKDFIDINSENLEGTYLDQNHVEQKARGRVFGEDGKVNDTNITDGNFDILKNLFCKNFAEINFEGFTKDLYKEKLITNNGSLSNTLLAMYERLGGLMDEDEKKKAKKVIGSNIWPAWANAVTASFVEENQDKLTGRDVNVVLAAKVGASQECLENAMQMFGVNSEQVTYLQGDGMTELLEENKEGVPYVIYSGKYSNHNKKAGDLAKEMKLGVDVNIFFANKVFCDSFKCYLQEQVNERQKAVTTSAENLGVEIVDAREFVGRNARPQPSFCSKVLGYLFSSCYGRQ